eukprot:TRINITY_DN22866_c0_g1_i1.p1 TRINITY_DN22866_c0_g1~~TRINITY_DN22866_c0_g1_i1.p1  ORF type:complete len:401 (+),score=123.87 TRINITY_DN22866_c0_g1_i1:232-1434(+)
MADAAANQLSRSERSKQRLARDSKQDAATAGWLDFVIQLLLAAVAQVAALLRWLFLESSGKEPVTSKGKNPPASSSPPTSGSSKGARRRGARCSPPTSGSTAVPAAEEPLEYIEKDRPETAAEKRIRSVKKKLLQIEALEEKALEVDLNEEQLAKLAGKADLLRELEELKQVAAVEAKEAAARAAEEARVAAEKASAALAAEERRAASKAAAEAALARKRREALEVLPNVAPESDAVRSNLRLQTLLKQVSELSSDVFHEDCLAAGVSKKKGWRLTLLARPVPEDPANCPPEDPTLLLGFIIFRFCTDFQCLSIAKIAVPEVHRGRGFGKHLMDWCVRHAEQQKLQHLSLSSLPEAVKFYKAFGFKPVKVESVNADDEDLVEGQVYMEYRLKGAGRRASV